MAITLLKPGKDDIPPQASDAARLSELQVKLRARQGQRGFEANCQALRDEIARLKGE